MGVDPDSIESRATVYPVHDQFVVVPADQLRERPYTLIAFHMSGTTIRLGPVDVPEGIELIDGLLSPNGWTPRFDPRTPIEITDMDAARRVLTVSPTEPIAGIDLFAVLRAKILADPEDTDEHDHAAALLAHIEAHRPWATYTGDHECLVGECLTTEEHPKCDIEPAKPLCSACTPVYEDGSEYTPAWLDACRITWPCAPLIAVAAHYEVPVDELVEMVAGCG